MTVEPLRLSFRRQLRERALEVAHQLTVDHGWDKVRVSEIAELTGVSRPTLYNEFGDKQGLGEALVLRESERFLIGVSACLEEHGDDLAAGVAAAVDYTLGQADASPVLRATLTAARGGDGLLPALTTRSAPILHAAAEVLGGWFAEHRPDLDSQVVEEAVDALVRLTVSHLVLPGHDRGETVQRLTRVALRFVDERPT